MPRYNRVSITRVSAHQWQIRWLGMSDRFVFIRQTVAVCKTNTNDQRLLRNNRGANSLGDFSYGDIWCVASRPRTVKGRNRCFHKRTYVYYNQHPVSPYGTGRYLRHLLYSLGFTILPDFDPILKSISTFPRLRFGRTLLLSHSFKLSSKDWGNRRWGKYTTQLFCYLWRRSSYSFRPYLSRISTKTVMYSFPLLSTDPTFKRHIIVKSVVTYFAILRTTKFNSIIII